MPKLLVLSLLFCAQSAYAGSIVDDYELIAAESGISEFSADLSKLFNGMQSRIFILEVDQAITAKIEHQPKKDWVKTYVRVSRSYIWLSKFAKREGLDHYAKSYEMQAQLYDDSAFGRDISNSDAVLREAMKLISAQPDTDDEASKASKSERDVFAIQYASGLWDVSEARADYDLATPQP